MAAGDGVQANVRDGMEDWGHHGVMRGDWNSDIVLMSFGLDVRHQHLLVIIKSKTTLWGSSGSHLSFINRWGTV
jgi:hypothetical protein